MREKEMTNRDWQKYGERFALNILTDNLKIPRENICDSESPDFLFEYEGKNIGAEVVEFHKNPKATEARKAYQKAIDKYRSKAGKLTSVIVFPENVAAFNGKKSEEELLEDIDNLLIDQDYDSRHIQSADEWDCDAESELPVSVCSIGECQHVKVDILEQTIRKKEKKLTEYKNSNRDIDEYWLIVYVDQYENDYIEKMEMPKIDSTYNRIYLTHLVDGVLRIK